MDTSKYSQSVVEVIKNAHNLAIKNSNTEVSELHLMYFLISDKNSEIQKILVDMGVVVDDFINDISNAIKKLSSMQAVNNLYLSRSYQKVLLVSQEISRNMYDKLVRKKHMFLAILKEDYTQSSKIASTFKVTYQSMIDEYAKIAEYEIKTGISKEILNTLSKYGTNLTDEAKKGKIDPVIGRDEETDNVIRVLCRRIKNNPVLIGEPGVGKTAIIEGLVQRIIKKEVPDLLKDKIIFSLDMTSLVAGAKYRGDFEDRLKNLLEIIQDSEGKIILFIDELHNIIGTGNTSGTMDTSNILKPMLARGQIRTIGATTIDEYKKYIEKDGALDRRFQKILVEEPSIKDTIDILNGIKQRYEYHHNIKITDEAIEQTVRLAKRYTNKNLPDIAIDIIDEGSSYARMQKKDILDVADIQAIISKMTNMPIKKISRYESKEDLKKSISDKFVGSEKLIDTVIDSYIRSTMGIISRQKPIGSYLLCGGDNVGKSYISYLFAKNIYDGEKSFIQLDMSEYTDKSSITKIIGAPPGYIGYDSGNNLSEDIRTRPYSVVLFENINLAQNEVLSIINQIISKAKIINNKGKIVDFKNTIIIATINIKTNQQNYEKDVKNILPSSFVNSFDDIFFMKDFDYEDLKKFVQIKLSSLVKELSENNIDAKIEDSLSEYIVEHAKDRYDKTRYVTKIIEQEIITLIAMKNIKNKKDDILITIKDGQIAIV